MPELPDIVLYINALEKRILDRPLEKIRLGNPFLLRTARPPISDCFNRKVCALQRIGKRIAIGLDNDHWAVIHLMIAGRLQWKNPSAPLKGKQNLAAFDFPDASLLLTEAGTQRRAALHIVDHENMLDQFDGGGLEVLDSTEDQFASAIRSENHTLKRTLTDPHLFSGIGNAYSDEILHRARLSPIAMSQKISDTDVGDLRTATIGVLTEWIERLSSQCGDRFPGKVTAFRNEMAVHGKFGEPCPECDAPVQRIRYADNETNYCAKCQTGGKVLADRSLSQLLKKDWPRTIEEWEAFRKPTLQRKDTE